MRLPLALVCSLAAIAAIYLTASDHSELDVPTADTSPTAAVKLTDTESTAAEKNNDVITTTDTSTDISTDAVTEVEVTSAVELQAASPVVGSTAVEETVATESSATESTTADAKPADITEAEPAAKVATHKEASVIPMLHDGKKVELNTFATDKKGNLLACVTAPSGDATEAEAEDGTKQPVAGYLQTYKFDGELLHETPLSFRPTAVNATPDGIVIVAGAGKVARIAADGKLLNIVSSPHLGSSDDMKAVEEKIAAEEEKARTASLARYESMVTQVAERIKAIEDKPEEERTSRDELLMKSLPEQKKIYEQQLTMMKQMLSQSSPVASSISRKMGITALAVTSRDVFLCCYAIEGRGYEVWRTNHDLTEPRRIMTGLGGCCGQCDIQAAGDNIAIAENTKFKVALVDRDGNRLSDFGARDRASVNGFGSCCNPMNVRCCSNGDILTGESSVGNIKRFSADGEYLGLIGKARIGGGCKHVALAHDEQRDRYYMMNVDQDHICVMLPLSEAPAMTEHEKLAQQAMDAHGPKFLGTWAAVPEESEGEPAKTRTVTVTKMVDGKPVQETREVPVPSSATRRYLATEYTFHSDGRLSMTGSAYANGNSRWEAIEYDEKSIRLALISSEVHSYDFLIEFADKEDEAKISMMYKTSVRGTGDFKRTCCEEGCEKKEDRNEASESELPVTIR